MTSRRRNDPRTTTERGLGWDHQQVRARLLAAHQDGTPCPCLQAGDCGSRCPCARAGRPLPMYRDATLNVDGRALEADHGHARALGGGQADRLMLSSCNRARGAVLANRLRGARRRGEQVPTQVPEQRRRVPIPRW